MKNLSDDERFKIEILLHEYDTLRNEIIARTGFGFELISIGAAVIIWISTAERFTARDLWIAVAGALVVFGVSIWVNIRDLTKAAERIRAIEANIDTATGESFLLQHERRAGVAGKGIMAWFGPTKRPRP